jgi:ferredoxin/flavodoxin---NADP+ reductase
MYEIVVKEQLTPDTQMFKVRAPDVAKKAKPGQFIVLRIDEQGERIPLTVADTEPDKGLVTIAVQGLGATTKRLNTMKPGESIRDFAGPLGVPTEIEKYGTVLCVAGGLGVAEIFPIARAMRQAGNKVVSIIGARTKDLLFWEERIRGVSDELIVTTDDGSYGRKALVTVPLKEVLDRGEKVDQALVVGPGIMMKFCCKTTEPYGVKTLVSINSIMVDGTGMCGACRIVVGGQTRTVCVDGPDFDGHLVDWDLLMARQRMYLDEEKRAMELFMCPECKAEQEAAQVRE